MPSTGGKLDKMNCAKAKLYVHGSLDHELDAVSDLALHEHLRGCESCASSYARHRELRNRLRSVLTGPAMPPDVERDIRRRLQQSIQDVRPRRWRASWVAALTAGVVAVGIVLGVWLGEPGRRLGAPDTAADKFVYQIGSADVTAIALQNIAFHLAAAPTAHIVVVTHNDGVDFLLKGASDRSGTPFEPRVAALAAKGVEFRVCNNTLNVRRIPASRVISVAALVPSGIAEVGRLEAKEGYSYIKP
jgi:intracellular sulfur oxidation DsrE/DsrF family protein